MEEEQMKSLADSLWKYFFNKYLMNYLSDSVCYFMATVTAAPSGGVIEVQRPFDAAISLPYAWSAETLQVGDTCLVMVFGDLLNSVVIGKGDLSDPGIFARMYSLTFAVADWTQSGTTYSISLPSGTHGCGANPMTQVLVLNGTNYEAYHGYPSTGWKVSSDADGNITLTTGTPFDGKIIVR